MGVILSEKIKRSSHLRSKIKKNSCSGCAVVILFKVSKATHPIPSNLSGINNLVLTAIFNDQDLRDSLTKYHKMPEADVIMIILYKFMLFSNRLMILIKLIRIAF